MRRSRQSSRPTVPAPSPSKRRAGKACKACQARKVRCTVTYSGPPCANCAVDKVLCEVPGRKRRRNPDLLSSTAGDQEEAAEAASISLPASHAVDSSDMTETEDRSAYAKALEPRRTRAEEGYGPIYFGDKRGAGFVIDICGPQTLSKDVHLLVAIPGIRSLDPEDLNYLRAKGAFSLPPAGVREALLQSYFHYVHPFAPILDPAEFIAAYEAGKVSLLLLWGMFLAGASFIDGVHLTDAFFPTRESLKKAVYQRAKVLYDVDYEKNKVVLIQSVYLLSHWFTNAEDRTGPWHWNGVAISLAHTVGFHRLSDSGGQGSVMKPVWRRLWWCIYCREAWLSQAQGRPMRTRLEDADTLLPTSHDFADHNMSIQTQNYLPKEITELLRGWLDFVHLSIVLGKILQVNHPATGSILTASEFGRIEGEVQACCSSPLMGQLDGSKVSISHARQLALYFEAVAICLYRPWVIDTPQDVPATEKQAWKSRMRQKARASASKAMAAVNAIMAEDLVGTCHSVTVLALLPVMHIHLLEAGLGDEEHAARSNTAQHNLALCMIAMDELRKIYLAADAAYKLFDAAIQKMKSGLRSNFSASSPTPERETNTQDVAHSGSGAWPGLDDPSVPGLFEPWPTYASFDLDGLGTDYFDHDWMDLQHMRGE